MDTRRPRQYSALGQEPVQVQESVGGKKIAISDMQLAYASTVFDQLEVLICNLITGGRELGIILHCQLMFDLQL